MAETVKTPRDRRLTVVDGSAGRSRYDIHSVHYCEPGEDDNRCCSNFSNTYAARPPTTAFPIIATTTMKCSLPSKFVRYSSLGMACLYVSLSLKACPNTPNNSLRSVTSSRLSCR